MSRDVYVKPYMGKEFPRERWKGQCKGLHAECLVYLRTVREAIRCRELSKKNGRSGGQRCERAFQPILGATLEGDLLLLL